MTATNNYVIKALDSYPYDLESAYESLTYALSYDDKDIHALNLMGRFYAEQMKDYETAKTYFESALAVNIHAHFVYAHYIDVLLWNEDFKEALKFIDFALKVKGSDKAVMYLKKALIYEYTFKYEKALDVLKESKKHCYNDEFMERINAYAKRVKDKKPKKRKIKRKKGE